MTDLSHLSIPHRQLRTTVESFDLTDTARRVFLNLRQRLAEEADLMFNMDSWFRWRLDPNGNSPQTPEEKQGWHCGYSACMAGTIALVEHPDIWDELDQDGVDDWMGSGNHVSVGEIALGALQECPPWEAEVLDPLWKLFFEDNWPVEFRHGNNPHASQRERCIMLIDALLDHQIEVVTTVEVNVDDGREWGDTLEVTLRCVTD